MGFLRQWNVGAYSANEGSVILVPDIPPPTGGYKIILLCHGMTNQAVTPSNQFTTYNAPNLYSIYRALLSAGYVLAGADLGIVTVGTTQSDNWGNANSIAEMSTFLTYVRSHVPAARQTGPVAINGGSMGSLTSLQYQIANPGSVACAFHTLPVNDLNSIYQNNPSQLFSGAGRASIGAAWGVVYPAALPAGSNPATLAAPATPLRLYYTVDDLICLPQTVVSYAAKGTNIEAISLGTGGHADPPLANVDMKNLLNWLSQVYP